MTIKELYEWAEQNNVENFNLEIELQGVVWKSVCQYDLFIDRLHEKVTIDTE